MKSEEIAERFVRVPEAAERLSISVRSLYRLIAAQEFPGLLKVGGCRRVSSSEIDAYMDRVKRNR